MTGGVEMGVVGVVQEVEEVEEAGLEHARNKQKQYLVMGCWQHKLACMACMVHMQDMMHMQDMVLVQNPSIIITFFLAPRGVGGGDMGATATRPFMLFPLD
jgi:hypothetical protein